MRDRLTEDVSRARGSRCRRFHPAELKNPSPHLPGRLSARFTLLMTTTNVFGILIGTKNALEIDLARVEAGISALR